MFHLGLSVINSLKIGMASYPFRFIPSHGVECRIG
ncbi:hypothetical protein AOG2_25370 [Geobacter sp. AOG2]|nr:hypothetical protein AOG2_25370 [Geobacter sp. AOG2]